MAFGSPGWPVSEGEDRYRRSLYTFLKRTAPFAMATTFDGPSGEACIARRNRSNTPLQALTLLNDPMFMDLAQVSGRRLAQLNSASDEERIRNLFESLLTRQPDDIELAALTEFTATQRRQLQDAAQQTKATNDIEPAVWAAVSRAVFALDEVVMRPVSRLFSVSVPLLFCTQKSSVRLIDERLFSDRTPLLFERHGFRPGRNRAEWSDVVLSSCQ